MIKRTEGGKRSTLQGILGTTKTDNHGLLGAVGQRTSSTGWTQKTCWMTDADSSKWQTVLHTAMHTLMCLIMDAPPPFPSLVFVRIQVEVR